jgi:predicted site-specific integrase-resolvase
MGDMKLSVWARQQGLSYKTAWRLWKAGQLPVPAEQLATGTVILHAAPANEPPGVWRYTPEFPPGARKRTWIGNWPVGGVLSPARLSGGGSGAGNWLRLEWSRKALVRIFRNPNVQVIVVEQRDRLMRFGFEYVETALAAQGRRVVVVDGAERTDDIVHDLQEVIVSMCARRYGKRAAKNRAKKAREAMQCE